MKGGVNVHVYLKIGMDRSVMALVNKKVGLKVHVYRVSHKKWILNWEILKVIR